MLRKSELIKILQDIPGDPIIGLPHPTIIGGISTQVHIHEDTAGNPPPSDRNSVFKPLCLQRYYRSVIKRVQPVVVFSIWPKL